MTMTPGDGLDLAAKLLMGKNPALTYQQAFAAALDEYPNLRADYAAPAHSKPDNAQAEAGDELDKLARQRMTVMVGESYQEALRHVMDAHPDLKQAYAGGRK